MPNPLIVSEGTEIILDDIDHGGPEVLEIGLRETQASLNLFCVHQDRADRLIELMSQRCGQLAHDCCA